MPPEMMTIVAPTAMRAKKLASVAVWISVYEFRKLLTLAPVTRSGCEPAKRVRSAPRLTMTRSRPACAELKNRLTIEWASRSVAGLVAVCAVELEGPPRLKTRRYKTVLSSAVLLLDPGRIVMTARLVALAGPLCGEAFPIDGPEWVVGRDPANRLSIPDRLISRRHCSVT